MSLSVILVHGAWTDGSTWSRVIPLLLDQGHRVVAAQIPLTSLADDSAVVRRLLAVQRGPTILVGHSYGGMVITEAATNSPNASGLVYVSAFVPDQGETLGELNARNPASAGPLPLRFNDPGFVWIDPAEFTNAFAQDLEPSAARVLAATQKPIAAKVFGEKAGPPAWKSLPAWYLVSETDRILSPQTQWFMARRIGAATSSVPGSHASLISHARETAELIGSAVHRIRAAAKVATPF